MKKKNSFSRRFKLQWRGGGRDRYWRRVSSSSPGTRTEFVRGRRRTASTRTTVRFWQPPRSRISTKLYNTTTAFGSSTSPHTIYRGGGIRLNPACIGRNLATRHTKFCIPGAYNFSLLPWPNKRQLVVPRVCYGLGNPGIMVLLPTSGSFSTNNLPTKLPKVWHANSYNATYYQLWNMLHGIFVKFWHC